MFPQKIGVGKNIKNLSLIMNKSYTNNCK